MRSMIITSADIPMIMMTKFLVSQCLFNDIIGRVLSVVCERRRSLGGLEVVRGMVCSGSGG